MKYNKKINKVQAKYRRNYAKIKNTIRGFSLGVLIALIILFTTANSFAHSGNTNKYGCHTKTKDNTYHCHNGKYKATILDDVDYDDLKGSSVFVIVIAGSVWVVQKVKNHLSDKKDDTGKGLFGRILDRLNPFN